MRSLLSSLSVFALALCCMQIPPADAVGFGKSKDLIWQSNANVFFKYETIGKKVAAKNDHPIELEEAKLHAAVSSIKLRSSSSGSGAQAASIFTDSQISLLAKYLTSGLASAKANQDVIFALDRTERKMAGLKTDQYYVAGRAFFRGGKLNLMIGDYDRPRDRAYEAAYDPTSQGIVKYDFDHGERTKNSSGFDRALISVEGIEKNRVAGTYRGDWFLIDVGAAAQAIVKQEKEKEVEELAVKRRELRAILGDNAVVEQRSSNLEQRFKTLESLKEQGLVTEAEYQEKRRELLSEL